MSASPQISGFPLRGISRLAFDAVAGLIGLVQTFSTTRELAMDHTTQDGANLVMRGRDAVECYYYADVDQNKLKLDLRRPSDSQYCPRENIFTKRLITNVRPANPTLTGEASINNFVSPEESRHIRA